MAMAEASLRARFGSDVCDHHIWAMVSDGDLSEGVSHEAASLAGHLGLGRLVYVYDDNHISIDGPTELALSDNAAKRFDAYGWHVLELGVGAEDLDALEQALLEAKSVEDRPSLVIVRSHIAYPSPRLTDSASAHGLAFKADDIAETKAVMGLPDEPFFVPDDVAAFYRAAGARGAVQRQDWESRAHGALSGHEADWEASLGSRGLPGWESVLPSYTESDKPATRVASGDCVAALAGVVPGLVAGAADLIGNTGTVLPGAEVLSADAPAGRQIHFGIREHAMGSIMVGAARHGGLLPVGGTFLVFSDYMRPAARLAALSGAKCVFVWTHDSVGVGEDGPTHQPVEHVMSLRLIPDLTVIRPADGNETAAAWRLAVDGDGPVALILSRQNTPVLPTTATRAVDGVAKGGYVIADADSPDVVLVGTGTEVAVALEAAGTLAEEGRSVQVVSLPCWDRFDAQDQAYRDAVLPPGVPTVSVEAGVTLGWDRYADASVGIDRFGASAPGDVVLRELGITAEHVAAVARNLLG